MYVRVTKQGVQVECRRTYLYRFSGFEDETKWCDTMLTIALIVKLKWDSISMHHTVHLVNFKEVLVN